MYTCPMHSEIKQNKPGKCPKCGMALILESELLNKNQKSFLQTYKPLLIIVGLILLVIATLTLKNRYTFYQAMQFFMGGFFIVFSGFKLLDIPGFVQGYATYDLLAKKIKFYGYLYPFIELGLGLFFITNIFPFFTNFFTLILMLFSSVGVAISLTKKQKFQCSCLGTIIDVPLGNVTLIEDLGMAIMAVIMLFNLY